MLTLIISDSQGASVVANVIKCSLDQETGLIGYRQALPHPVPGETTVITEVSFELADGDVLVTESGLLVAHLVTGPQAVKFRPGGPLANEEPKVPTFIGPAAPRGHQVMEPAAGHIEEAHPTTQ